MCIVKPTGCTQSNRRESVCSATLSSVIHDPTYLTLMSPSKTGRVKAVGQRRDPEASLTRPSQLIQVNSCPARAFQISNPLIGSDAHSLNSWVRTANTQHAKKKHVLSFVTVQHFFREKTRDSLSAFCFFSVDRWSSFRLTCEPPIQEHDVQNDLPQSRHWMHWMIRDG